MILALGLMFVRHSFSKVADTLPAEMLDSKRADLPTSPEELRAERGTVDSDNAAPIYRQAFIALSGTKRPKNWYVLERALQDDTATVEDRAVMSDVLRASDGALALIARGATYGKVDWNRKWEDGQLLMFPEFARLKEAAKLLSDRVRLLAMNGRGCEAIRDCATMYALARHAAQDETVIAILVAYSIDQIASAALFDALDRCRDAKSQAAAKTFLEGLAPLPVPEVGLKAETVLMLASIQHVEKFANQTSEDDCIDGCGGLTPYDSFPGSWLIRDPSFRRAWQAKLLHYTTAAYSAAVRESTWPGKRKAFEDANSRCEDDGSLENYLNRDLTFIAGAQFADSWARANAARAIDRAAVQALEQYGKTHAWPTAVYERDPFSTKPLMCRSEQGGFRLYSVDVDGVDDHGLTRKEDKRGTSKTHDIARVLGDTNRHDAHH